MSTRSFPIPNSRIVSCVLLIFMKSYKSLLIEIAIITLHYILSCSIMEHHLFQNTLCCFQLGLTMPCSVSDLNSWFLQYFSEVFPVLTTFELSPIINNNFLTILTIIFFACFSLVKSTYLVKNVNHSEHIISYIILDISWNPCTAVNSRLYTAFERRNKEGNGVGLSLSAKATVDTLCLPVDTGSWFFASNLDVRPAS